ncbi:carbamoyltransferase [Frankia sp. Cas3]|uniref:carbamoyltransferase family protein n=1 Tax=Frankia sp. Cas3 TaxID=3073926 RepID=UPI002AD2E5A4|nr:carbamoyltransferase C-terminal domain-containing protein [Frankia sp. Cas3]
MLTLGLSGYFDSWSDSWSDSRSGDSVPRLLPGYFHDASACLTLDGQVIAAVEEERLDRVKHTNKFPHRAIRACLEETHVDPSEIDSIAFFFEEEDSDKTMQAEAIDQPSALITPARQCITERLNSEFGDRIRPVHIDFVSHHVAHAASTFFHSGFDTALVLIMDGNGEHSSGSLYRGDATGLIPLKTFDSDFSLGQFYNWATRLLGYRLGDEYKVMGLASYGDPTRFRAVLGELFQLCENGDYRLEMARLPWKMLEFGYRPRRAKEPFSAVHRDFAAAVQEVLVKIVLHVLEHWRRATGLDALCMAGGVAQNSSMTGQIIAQQIFDRVFVHPASHDAGASVGAALYAQRSGAGDWPVSEPARRRPRNACWGPGIGDNKAVLSELEPWGEFLRWEEHSDIAATAARLLAEGSIMGWVQGRSEFGPRALGNRSILADPRPAENRDRINMAVKRREDYRPFAPAVLAELAGEYFELPADPSALEYMGFVVPVRTDKRELLGAVTHVDGSARIQIVTDGSNPRFRELIARFGEITGTPVLLNTSFNNNAEPIVQSVNEAIACFLTTEIDVLVVGDFITKKRPFDWRRYGSLSPRLAPFVEVRLVSALGSDDELISGAMLAHRDGRAPSRAVSTDLGTALTRADGKTALADLLPNGGLDEDVVNEIRQLWTERLIALAPVPGSSVRMVDHGE